MVSKAGEVYIDVKADFAQFTSEMTKASRDTASAVAGINTSLGSVSQGIDALKSAAATLGIAFGVDAFVGFVKSAMSAAAAIKDLATQAGVTAEDFQVLQFAARENGASADQMSAGIEHLTRSIGEAVAGSKTAIDGFNSLGVKLLDVHGNVRATDDVLIEIAQHVAAAKTPADQARIAFEAFGKSGQSLIPTLIEIGQHFDATKQKAHDMAQVYDDETIKASNDLKTSWEELGIALEVTAAKLIAGPLKSFFDWFKDSLNEATRAVEQSSIRKEPGTGSWWDFLIPSISFGGSGAGTYGARRTPMLTPTSPGIDAGAYQPAVVGGGMSQAQKDAQAYAQTVAGLQAEMDALSGDSDAIKLNTSLRAAHAAAGSAEAATITQMVAQIQAEKDAQADLKVEAEAENAERSKAASLLDSLQSKTEAYASTQAELGKYLNDNVISQTQYNNALEELRLREVANDPIMKQAAADAKEFNSAIGDLASSLGQDLLRAFTDTGSAADRWKNLMVHALQDVLNVVDSLIKKLLENTVTGTLGSILGGAFSPVGTVLGPLAGAPALLASGGHMGIGDWAIVGEAGPELVYADTPGNVMSAERTRGVFGGGGESGNVAYIDARGADSAAIARLEAALSTMNYSFEHRAIAAVTNERRRGGAFAATFGR